MSKDHRRLRDRVGEAQQGDVDTWMFQQGHLVFQHG